MSVLPELRNVEKELKELAKAVDTRFIDEKELRVLNLLPVSHAIKVRLYEEMVIEAQQKQLKEVKTIDYK